MNKQQNPYDLTELIKNIEDIDFNKTFKTLVLDFLRLLEKNRIKENILVDLMNKFEYIKEEIQIHDIFNKINDIEFAYYYITKAFLSSKNLRNSFLRNVKADSLQEKDPQLNLRPFLYIGLFEFFMCNTHEREVEKIFEVELEEFYEFFYDLVLSDISKSYYESNTMLYYFDCEMWNILGKKFRKFISNKIRNCVKKTDANEFMKIYSNFYDILHSDGFFNLFCDENLNLFHFLIKNLKEEQILGLSIELFHNKEEISSKVIKCIRKTIINFLPDYRIEKWNDPLFLLGFFDYLTKDDLEKLIEDPRVDVLDLILKNKSSHELFDNPTEEQKEYLKEKGLNINKLLLKELCKNDLEIYAKLWKEYAWWLISTKDFKNLIQNDEFNFIENLFLTMHYIFKNPKSDEMYISLPLMPSKIRQKLSIPLKTKLAEIIKKKEMKTFVPLCAYNYLFMFSREEIISMIKDPNISLMRLVLEAFDSHEDEMYFYNESSFEIENKFFKILREMSNDEIYLLIKSIIQDHLSLKYPALITYGILEKICSELPKILNSEKLLKNFISSLSKSVIYSDELERSISSCYQYIPNKLSNTQIEWIVDIFKNSEPIGNSWDLPKVFDILRWYGHFNDGQLNAILKNIKRKSGSIRDLGGFFPYIIANLDDRLENPDFKEIIKLVSKASEGIDNFEKGAVGFMNYGFVFKNSISKYYFIEDHHGKCCAAGSMRGFIQEFEKRMKYKMNIESLYGLKKRDDKLDLFLAGSLKTLLPGLRFGGDELLFDVWMLVKTPEKKIFPAIFYYGASGPAIGGYGMDLEKFPKDLQSIVNSSVYELKGDDLEMFLDALEFALNKVPISDFVGIYEHDLGRLKMGIIGGEPFSYEIGY